MWASSELCTVLNPTEDIKLKETVFRSAEAFQTCRRFRTETQMSVIERPRMTLEESTVNSKKEMIISLCAKNERLFFFHIGTSPLATISKGLFLMTPFPRHGSDFLGLIKLYVFYSLKTSFNEVYFKYHDVHLFKHILICMFPCACVCMWERGCKSVCMCMHVHVCTCVKGCTCTNVFAFMYVCAHPRISVPVFVCACMYMCACV